MTEQDKKINLMNAWKKICLWTKENCAGKFPEGIRFNAPHNPYIWYALVINANGEARIYRGDHSSESPNYVLTEFGVYGFFKSLSGNNHMEEDLIQAKDYNCNVIYGELEEIVRSWPSFKAEIMREIAWSDSIESFEP